MGRLTREEAIEADIIHDEDHQRNLGQLEALYGRVADAQNQWILAHCEGREILDVGAGYGNLTRLARRRGFECTGIEIDEQKIARAKDWFQVDLEDRDIHESGYPCEQFDTVIFREVIRHLRLQQAMTQAARLCRRRVLIFQANPIWLLKVANRIVSHHEHMEYTLSDIKAALGNAGLTCRKVIYSDVLAFPLSGGYVSRQLVPKWPWTYGPVLRADRWLGRLCRALGLGKLTCFRMLIIAEKQGDGRASD